MASYAEQAFSFLVEVSIWGFSRKLQGWRLGHFTRSDSSSSSSSSPSSKR
jgi:hypothetical protein